MTPSPQTLAQALGEPEQRNPASMMQEAEQPSSMDVLPSSQVSPASVCPLPHTIPTEDEDVEEEDAKMNVGEEETEEAEEEEGEADEGADEEVPAAMQEHWEQNVPWAQCSLSSHCSVPFTMPSPQTVWQTLGQGAVFAARDGKREERKAVKECQGPRATGEQEASQTHPFSVWHTAEQPSLPRMSMSSQVSVPATMPSPQDVPQ